MAVSVLDQLVEMNSELLNNVLTPDIVDGRWVYACYSLFLVYNQPRTRKRAWSRALGD